MALTRRRLIGAGGLLVAAGLTEADAPARPGRFPPFATTARLRFETPGPLAERVAAAVARYLAPTPDHPGHPSYPGAAALIATDGQVYAHVAVGDAVRYGPSGVELAVERRVPARAATLYDLASLTKLFTAIVALRLVEIGELRPTAPVTTYLPEFAARDQGPVTAAMLLTHVSGLPEDIDLSFPGNRTVRLAAVLGSPLGRGMRPGGQFHYSDLGLITLGAIAERVTGARLDELVRSFVTEPLGMRDTMFNPPPALRERCAATEEMPWTGRGMVRGQVHDEKAYHLGGIAGHAGLFGTAADVGRLAQALLAGGNGVLRPATVAAMLVNRNGRFGPGAAHGLGVELNQRGYMGRLAGRWSFGHTGFTGTSLVADPVRGTIAVLLTNRVHPTRRWGSINPARRALADAADEG